jgi:hypothetical protein
MEGVRWSRPRQPCTRVGPADADDRFNLIEFNSDSRLLFSQSVRLMKPGHEALTHRCAVGNGAQHVPALRDAVALPVRTLRQFFITDGSVNGGTFTANRRPMGASRCSPFDWRRPTPGSCARRR